VWLHGMLAFYEISMQELEAQLPFVRQEAGAKGGEADGGPVRKLTILQCDACALGGLIDVCYWGLHGLLAGVGYTRIAR